MIFFPLTIHPELGFTIPSYNAREALKRIAESFVSGTIASKPGTLIQKLRPQMVFSSHVLFLGHQNTLAHLPNMLKALIAEGNIRIDDPKIGAWIKIDQDTPQGANPVFIIREEPRLIEKVDGYFKGFIDNARRRGTDDGVSE